MQPEATPEFKAPDAVKRADSSTAICAYAATLVMAGRRLEVASAIQPAIGKQDCWLGYLGVYPATKRVSYLVRVYARDQRRFTY